MQDKTHYTHKVSTVCFDDVRFNVKSTGAIDLLFSVLTNENTDNGRAKEADVVAAIRIESIARAKEIYALLGQVIKDQENMEP